MGAYALAGGLLVLALALVLWWGWPLPQVCAVELPGDSTWSSATLDDGGALLVVLRGERIALSPGRYRLLLEAPDGHTSQQGEIVVDGPLTRLGSAPTR